MKERNNRKRERIKEPKSEPWWGNRAVPFGGSSSTKPLGFFFPKESFLLFSWRQNLVMPSQKLRGVVSGEMAEIEIRKGKKKI